MSDYYVNFDTGSDANDGSSSSPWKRCPGDTAAADNAAAAVLAPGDTVYFRSGVAYVGGQIRLNWSGSSGSPIRYIGDQWGGTARAVLTTQNVSSSSLMTNNNVTRNWLVIEGIEFSNIGGYTEDGPIWTSGIPFTVDTGTDVISTSSPHGFVAGQRVAFSAFAGTLPAPLTRTSASIDQGYMVKTVPSDTTLTITAADTTSGTTVDITTEGSGEILIWGAVVGPPGGGGINLTHTGQNTGASNVTIRRCLFSEIGQWQNQMPMTGINSMTGTAISLFNAVDILIEDCEMTKVRVGVGVKARGTTERITVRRCTIHDYVVWGMDVAAQQAGAVFRDLIVEDSAVYDFYQADSGNWMGAGEKPHTDGLFFRSPYSATWEDIVVRGCLFYKSTQAGNGGTASVYASEGVSLLAYNNLFLNDKHGAMVWIGGASKNAVDQEVRLYNNTLIGPSRLVIFHSTTANPDVVDIRNNLFYRTSDSDGISINLSRIASFSADRNVFYHVNPAKVYSTPSTLRSLDSWQTFSGEDANSIFADPLLANISGSNPASWDTRPVTGSPLFGLGDNLSSHFTTDRAGVTRPAEGAWTVGAYQLAAGEEPEPPPDPEPTPAAPGKRRRGAKLLGFL